MKNKGQVLVIFVLFIPIFILVLALVIDLTTIATSKRHLDNSLYDAVKVGLTYEGDNLKQMVGDMVTANNPNIISLAVETKNEKLLVTTYMEVTGTILLKNQEIKSEYIGEIVAGEIKITKG